MPATASKKCSMSFKSSGQLIGAAAAFILIVGGMGWWINLNADPTAFLPTPTLPSPNAFDDFIAAGNAIVDEKGIDDAANFGPGIPGLSLEQKAAVVKENAVALTRLRIGLTEEYGNPPVRSFTTSMPHYARFRRLARVLRVEGDVRAERGDYSGAMQSGLDGIKFATDIPRGGVLIAMLVGNACESIARKPLWDDIDHLTAAESKRAAQHLEAGEKNRFSFSDTMQEEKWAGQAGILEIFHGRNSFQLAREMAFDSGSSTGSNLASAAPYLRYSKRTMFANYTRAMDQFSQVNRAPYFLAKRTPPPIIPRDPICQMTIPVFSQSRFHDTLQIAENALLETTLALHAYRLEHGCYPDSLLALAPVYLQRVPDDPFAVSGQLRYKKLTDHYLLYSVGPDGKDDRGEPITKKTPFPFRPIVQIESTGDIVAGVTR